MARVDDFNRIWMMKNKLSKKEVEASKDEKAQKLEEDGTPSQATDNTQGDQNGAAEAEPKYLRADILGDDRPRVLAYSDSDSDVESHFKRVKDHLLPGHDEPKEGEQEGASEGAQEAAAAETVGTVQRKGMSKLLSQLASLISTQLSPPVLLRAAALIALRQTQTQAASIVEVASCAVSVAAAVFKRSIPSGSHWIQTVNTQSNELAKAALLVAALRYAGQARQRALTNRVEKRHSGVNVHLLESAVRSKPVSPPVTAADFAALYAPEMNELKRILNECGVNLPTPRFDDSDAELFRFAKCCGLLKAESPAERAVVVEKAVRRIVDLCEWLGNQKLFSDNKLRKWERLVVWRSSDHMGRPILLIRIGRAFQLCKSDRLHEFADAVISQIIAGVNNSLSNVDGPEKFVIVMDCRDASNVDLFLKSRDSLGLLKRTAAALNAHFPDRLEKLFLLELPLMGKAALQGVTPLLHPDTPAKFAQVTADDESLPITVALLWKRRSVSKRLSRTMSDVSSGVSSAGTSGRSSPHTPGSPRPAGDFAALGATEVDAVGVGSGDKASVAINLLPVLEKEQGTEEFRTPFIHEPGSDGGVTPGEVRSHLLPMTPSMLTPQTSVDATADEDHQDEAKNAGATLVVGLGAFLSGAISRKGAVRRRARERLKAHRIPMPTSPQGSSPRTPRKKGGLIDLPMRSTWVPTSTKGPSKPSLLRSKEASHSSPVKRLGSFPLRRQSSVTWANELTKVREIESTPPSSKRPSMDVVNLADMQKKGLAMLLVLCGCLMHKVLLPAAGWEMVPAAES